MFSRFLPREEKFFDLFGELAGHIVEGAQENRKLFADLSQRELRVRKLEELERRGDEVTHRTRSLLRSAFLTPISKEDLHELVTALDNVLDLLELVAQRVSIYDVQELPAEAFQLADLCLRCAVHVRDAVAGLDGKGSMEPVLRACAEIDRLEGEADKALRAALRDLFAREIPAHEILKVKEICDLLENITDCCNDVGSLVDRLILERVE